MKNITETVKCATKENSLIIQGARAVRARHSKVATMHIVSGGQVLDLVLIAIMRQITANPSRKTAGNVELPMVNRLLVAQHVARYFEFIEKNKNYLFIYF